MSDFIKKASGLNRRAWFELALKTYPRIAICGGPNTGKTTLARLVKGRPVIHTDSFMERSWEAVPHAVIAKVYDETGGGKDPFVIEGVQAPRTLRKGLEVDAVLWLDQPLEPESKGQASMRKGCMTVLADYYADNKHIPMLQAPPVNDRDENDKSEAT